jgi:hypothetical protein
MVSVPGVTPVTRPEREPTLAADVLDHTPPDTQSESVTGEEMQTGGMEPSGQTDVVTVITEVTKQPDTV